MNIEQWFKTLQGSKPKALINLKEATGIGDLLNSTSALRYFRKDHPEHIIIAVVDDFYKYDVLRNNPNIDFLVPAYNCDVHWNEEDFRIFCHWSFLEQHKHPIERPHVCGSYMWHINGYYNEDMQMEMFQNNQDIKYVDELMKQLPKDKPLVAISPAWTMFNRMISQREWSLIANKLSKKYTVLSIGGASDFVLENVIDLRCKLKLNQIPHLLNYCEKAFAICSGFLHICGCNPDIEIVFLNSGEFPTDMHVPVRNIKRGWNCKVIEHDCPYKAQCFEGHIKETEYQKQLKNNIMKYGDKYSTEILKKYTAWKYCFKSEDKYSCSRFVMKNLLASGLLD